MRRTSSSLWGPTVGAQYLTLRVLGPRTTARVWGADSELSGCARSTGPTPKSCTTWAPASRTGVPNKYYRGPRQASSRDCRRKRPTTRANKPNLALTRPHENVPGSPTNTTGVPDKYHRGPRQVALSKVAAKRGCSCRVLGFLCFCFSCSVMLLNNNYRANGEVFPWGPITSS